jgi:heptosyltransferase-1
VDTRRWRRLLRRPAGLAPAWREIAAARRALRGLGLDVAVDAQGLLKSGIIAAATGAGRRIGFAADRCRERASAAFTNQRVRPPAEARHVVEQYLALLGPLGIAAARPEFRVPAWPDAECRIRQWLAARGVQAADRLVVVSPGAGRPDKQWPAAAFRAVAQAMVGLPAVRVLAVWGPGERPLAAAVAGDLGARAAVAPPTDLQELAALLRCAALVVAGDTGPLHLAAAVGAPCLGLFGPTSAERNGPYGPDCRALSSPDRSMGGLDPGRVAGVVREMLHAA